MFMKMDSLKRKIMEKIWFCLIWGETLCHQMCDASQALVANREFPILKTKNMQLSNYALGQVH